MKWIRPCLILPMLAAVVSGCDRSESSRIAEPAAPAAVSEAGWVWGSGLESGVRSAASSPVVRRALYESSNPRLTPMWQFAVRSVGRMSDGTQTSVTILPYLVDADSTHALYVSYIEDGAVTIAEPSELIVGREPTSLETGFVPSMWGERQVWIKTGPAYKVTSAGRVVPMSPERLNWPKFLRCFADRAPGYCNSGAAIAMTIAPTFPYSAAIGCGAGMAYAALECAISSIR